MQCLEVIRSSARRFSETCESAELARQALSGNYQEILVASDLLAWIRQKRTFFEEDVPPANISRVSGSGFVLTNGVNVRFTLLDNPDKFRGCRWDLVFLEENDVRRSNYNEFPWSAKDRREEKQRQEEYRAAWNASIEKSRQRMMKEVSVQESSVSAPNTVSVEVFDYPEALSAGLDAMASLRAAVVGRGIQDDEVARAARTFRAAEEEITFFNVYPREIIEYRPMARSNSDNKLAVIRGILLRHLKLQLRLAPGPDSIYSSDDGVITARDIAAVVDALEPEPTERINFNPNYYALDPVTGMPLSASEVEVKTPQPMDLIVKPKPRKLRIKR